MPSATPRPKWRPNLVADKSVEVKVTGLTELVGAFRAVDANLPEQLRTAFMGVAKYVVGVAQQRMTIRSGEAASSLKAVAGSTYAGISRPAGGTPWQGTKADYYPWLDFGGSTGKGHDGTPWSGSVKRSAPKGGRYLYPAIAEATPEFVKAADEAIATVAAEAGFETHGSIG